MTGIGRTARTLLLLVAAPRVLESRWPNFAVNAQNVGITCFGIGGQSYANNTRCPGSNACCGHRATCLSNRLCHNPGDGPEVWVRGPCAQRTFDDTCGQICLYNETETGGGVLPRVTPCGDGSLCCNNDPQCCQNKRGIFLDESGNRISTRATAATTSYPPAGTGTERFTQTPSTSTPITRTTTAASETTRASNSGGSTSSGGAAGAGVPGSDSSPGNGESTSLKVGLGLSIPLAVLLSAMAVYFWLRKRQKRDKKTEPGLEGSAYIPPSTSDGQGSSFYGHSYATAPPPPLVPVPKLDLPYYSGRPAPLVEAGSSGVRELPADQFHQQRPHELG